jgi:hypothetical protein
MNKGFINWHDSCNILSMAFNLKKGASEIVSASQKKSI